jgi:hypothetical protein
MAVYIPSVTQHLRTLNFLHVIYGKVGRHRHTPIIFYRGGLNLRQYILYV